MALDEGAGAGAGAGGDAGAGAVVEGFGGAADLLGGAVAAAAEGSGQGAAADGDAGGTGGAGDGAADPDWYGSLSADAEGERASLRDWVKSSGVKDLNGLAKIARDNQVALRDSGRIKVPGEGATAEEIAAFNRAIGVPDGVEGYELPQLQSADGEIVKLDDSLLGKLLPKAHALGVPASMMSGLASEFVQLQLDAQAAEDASQIAEAKSWVEKQGASSTAKLAAIDTVASALGLTKSEMMAFRGALGAGRAMDILSRLGEGMAEDTMLTGGRGRFSVTGREAQAELDQMKSKAGADKAFAKAVQTEGTPENARWHRLQAQAATWAQQERDAA